MPSKYKTKRQEAIEHVNNVLLPELRKTKDKVSKENFITNLYFNLGISPKLAEEALNAYIILEYITLDKEGNLKVGKKQPKGVL